MSEERGVDLRTLDAERSIREREALNSLVQDLADSSHSIRDVLIRLADAAREGGLTF